MKHPNYSKELALCSAAVLLLGACGAKSDWVEESIESQEGLPECPVENETRECRSICGPGIETCIQGEWRACSAPRPGPPRIEATVRDFSDDHPDFERPGGSGGNDMGMVEFELGRDGKPDYAGRPKTPTTTNRETFNQWYNDTDASITLQTLIKLEPSEDDPSLYVSRNSAFFPIDDQGFGNEERTHNYHFTLELETAFRYLGGDTFKFSGDDDVWVFINRRLAIDIGGTHVEESRTVALDQAAEKLGLVLGETYPLHLFFAERHTVGSNFNIETTISEFDFCD